MERDRSDQIARICRDALARDVAERAVFVAEACSGDEGLLREVESILTGSPSDVLSAHGDDLRDGILQSNAVADSLEGAAGTALSRSASLPFWARVIVVAAALRTATALAVYLGTDHVWPTRQLPYPVYAALTSVFTGVGLALVLANRRDLRASWLGGVFVLLGAPLANPFLINTGWLFFIRLEAFNPAFFWRFITLFPDDLEGRIGTFVKRTATFIASVGLLLFAADLVAAFTNFRRTPVAIALRLHWAVLLAMHATAFPVLIWRTASAHGPARGQARIFACGLLLGVAPVSLEVLVEEIWRPYWRIVHRPDVEPVVGTIIFGALAIVPFVTAYSVLYDHVVEMRVVLRAAIQYALARYTIIAATLVPFAALATFAFRHRDEPLVALISGPRPLGLIAFAAAGIAALRLRDVWLESLDRKYFREPYDAPHILTRIVTSLPGDSDVDIVERVREEVGRALHVDIEIFLVDMKRSLLRHVRDDLPSLDLPATIVDLVLADSRPMDVDLEAASSPFRRLPDRERRWLRSGDFRLLVPLRAASGRTTAIMAATRKRSDLPYSDEDRRLLVTIAATASLALDSLRLRSTPEAADEPPARECRSCSRLSPPEAARCPCGGPLVLAAAPYMLRGVYRLKQRIGAGGMGVVYRAVDLNLERDVAIKALPRVTPAHRALLRREARAMAAVTHTNLAVVYGIEIWQGTPFLVQEYLAGGTLAQRLAVSRPPTLDAVKLAITLADTLQYIHIRGVIHCDIKPSNIGFTEQGTVKLLDFGLARVLRGLAAVGAESTTIGAAIGVPPQSRVIGGTPPFMSPEAVRGEVASPRVDLWALCVVLYQSLTGKYPFTGPDKSAILARILEGSSVDISTIRPDLPSSFWRFFKRAFALDPSQRQPDGNALAVELRRLLADCG